MRKCINCGADLEDDAMFCPNCGTSQTAGNRAGQGQFDQAGQFPNNQDQFQGGPQGQQPYQGGPYNQGGLYQGPNKGIAIVAYITWIGFVIALIMNSDKQDSFVRFHLNQSLVLWLFSFLGFIPVVGWIIVIAIFTFSLMGLINAANGQYKEVPLIGKIHLIDK